MRTETKRSYVITNINSGIVTAPTTTTTTTTTINPYGWRNLIDENVWGITVGDGGGYFIQDGPVLLNLPTYRDISTISDFIDGYSCVVVEASYGFDYTKISAFTGKDNTEDNFSISRAWRPTKLRVFWEPSDYQCVIWVQNWNGHNIIDSDMYNHDAIIISSGDEIEINWHEQEYLEMNDTDYIGHTLWWVEICPVNGWRTYSFKLTQFEAYGLDPYEYI